VRCWLRFQRLDNNALVHRVARNNLPVMEDCLAERLALCMGPEISLKAKGVDSR
jgi:hypothetical protein